MVALPRPLDGTDAARIKRIFAAQRCGDLASAFRDSAALETSKPLGRALLGHVLADRYLSRFYRASAAELSGWLIYYADEPDAPAVRALLAKRLPRGAAVPPPPPRPKPDPSPALASAPIADPLAPAAAEPAGETIARNARLDRAVQERVTAGKLDGALQLIAQARDLDASYAAALRAEVAQALFTRNRDEEALKLADAAVRESGGEVGLASYVAGLAAWRLGRHDEAQTFFETVTDATYAPPALLSAGSFWAARTHQRAHDPAGFAEWMTRAAESPRTFYGLLARRVIDAGAETTAHPVKRRIPLSAADVQAVAAEPEGVVAFALLEVGQTERAESELRRIVVRARKNIALRRAVRLVAEQAKLPNLPTEMASLAPTPKHSRAAANAEVADLQPRDGFRVDPALIYALARLESNFDSSALSRVGARGLMQIMPMTASYMAGDEPLDHASLDDPGINLELGQRYVLYLAQHGAVEGDLIRLLASYNAGPARCAEWDIRDLGDPLMFLEAIPIPETRMFVQRVLAYSWAYAARFGLPAPSLNELAGGAFPRFRAMPTSLGKQAVAQATRPQLH